MKTFEIELPKNFTESDFNEITEKIRKELFSKKNETKETRKDCISFLSILVSKFHNYKPIDCKDELLFKSLCEALDYTLSIYKNI